MIVDFQHHFTPRELIKEDPGNRRILHYDENGAPSYTIHSLLYDLDEHVAMMDASGIDAAFLTSAAGMCAGLDVSKIVNDNAKKAERDYPGRFIGAAHAHPLGGKEAFKELSRCVNDLGFPGVWYGIGSGQLHLIQCPPMGMKIDPSGPHFAIEVADLDEARRQIAAAGLEVLDPGGNQLWVLDPDGYTVEITQLSQG